MRYTYKSRVILYMTDINAAIWVVFIGDEWFDGKYGSFMIWNIQICLYWLMIWFLFEKYNICSSGSSAGFTILPAWLNWLTSNPLKNSYSRSRWAAWYWSFAWLSRSSSPTPPSRARSKACSTRSWVFITKVFICATPRFCGSTMD